LNALEALRSSITLISFVTLWSLRASCTRIALWSLRASIAL
jgi:hypothetical protein